jgi:hypothetical protein
MMGIPRSAGALIASRRKNKSPIWGFIVNHLAAFYAVFREVRGWPRHRPALLAPTDRVILVLQLKQIQPPA